MEKPKFRYVSQKYENDCAVACLAMITGYSYEKVDKRFNYKKGIKFSKSVDYLQYQGIGIIIKEWIGCQNINYNNKLMAQPYADIHLISVKQYADSPYHHAIVMDKNGQIYDPGDKTIKDLNHYYEIVKVAGCFYEKRN